MSESGQSGGGDKDAARTQELEESGPRQQAPAPGRLVADRYTVLEMLGEGGMGMVVAAYDARLDRRVALKLMRSKPSARSDLEAESRLVREAQAMARLSHPNVVAVYDAGALEDGSIFIAMEHVQGQTLRQWCSTPRTWREVLNAYLDAGRGLAAAHAAGLVHRDFKPDNVLVGNDRRVRVTDFGLARATFLPNSTPSSLTPTPTSSDAWENTLTRPGVIVGTPRYMAPEVLSRRSPADARSDLFSFCVSLYEALYGQHAFQGDTADDRQQARIDGRINPPPAKSEVPAWIARPLLQGLAPDPAQRPGSMPLLLRALQDDPEIKRGTRLRMAALASLLAGLTALATWGWVRQREQPSACAHPERRLAGIWDDAVKAKVKETFTGTGLAYASATAERVLATLDGYAGAWVKMRGEVCEAVREQAGQSRSLAVLREECLERRRSQLQALTELLARAPDRELLPKAVQAAQALPPLDYCADTKALIAAVPPPEDPAVRAKVEALQTQLDRLDALFDAGKYKQGLGLTEELLKQVAEVDFAPVKARALLRVAWFQDGIGDYKGSEARAREALLLAAQGKDDVLLAKASNLLVVSVGYAQGRPQEAVGLELMVKAAAERAGDARARAEAFNNLGIVFRAAGKPEEARAYFQRAFELRQKVLGPENNSVASTLNSLGSVSFDQGKYDEAEDYFQRSLAMWRKVLGPEHPSTTQALNSVGAAHLLKGNLAEARATFEEAAAIRERVLGPEHPSVAQSLNNLGDVYVAMGKCEEARSVLERAVAIRQKALGPEHPSVAQTLHMLGGSLECLGKYREAQPLLERSLAVWQKALGPDHANLAYPLTGLGRVLVHTRALGKAEGYLKRALALREKTQGKDGPELAEPLVGLAELRLAQRRPKDALPLLERALPLAASNERPEVQLQLADVLWTTRGDRKRARELAAEAQQRLERIGHPDAARASRWLAAHVKP